MSKPKDVSLSIASIPALLAVCVFSAASFLRSPGWLNVTQSPTSPLATVNQPLENIRFTIYDLGIYPQEIEVNARHLGIVFEDRTGRSSGFVVQRITENTSQEVAQLRMMANRSRTRGEVKLTPGRYRVFDTSRPEIYSTLIVSP